MKRLYEFLINSKSTGIIKNINDDFVDLGLSVLWAKCNIGAEKETDYGHYYQWGGLEPMDNKECNWENAPFNDGHYCFNKKYFESIKDKVCPNRILSKEYDIATQTLGNKCKIPTYNKINELINNTDTEWVNINGVEGRTFSSSNGNYIFIPAAGYRIQNSFADKNKEIRIWSSENSDYVMWFSYFLDTNRNAKNYKCQTENLWISSSDIFFAYTVRAVKEK